MRKSDCQAQSLRNVKKSHTNFLGASPRGLQRGAITRVDLRLLMWRLTIVVGEVKSGGARARSTRSARRSASHRLSRVRDRLAAVRVSAAAPKRVAAVW